MMHPNIFGHSLQHVLRHPNLYQYVYAYFLGILGYSLIYSSIILRLVVCKKLFG